MFSPRIFVEMTDKEYENYKTLLQNAEKGDMVSQIQSIDDLHKVLIANDFKQIYSNIGKDAGGYGYVENLEYARDNITIYITHKMREECY